MKKHTWSRGVVIYEFISKFTCRDCGACITSDDEPPSDEDILRQKLPLDCDEAIPIVIHEEYASSESIDPWDEDDIGSPLIFDDTLSFVVYD